MSSRSRSWTSSLLSPDKMAAWMAPKDHFLSLVRKYTMVSSWIYCIHMQTKEQQAGTF